MPGAPSYKDVLSTLSLPRSFYEGLFRETDALRRKLSRAGVLNICKGRILATVFMEPSTRTRLSFQFAMTKIGGEVIDFGPVESTSTAKGETFEDSMRMVDGYSPDAIVVRSKVQGSAKLAADLCSAPVINAGDGSNEHPTQAMLDLYTIHKLRGKIDGAKIGLMGDLAHSRTTSSLSYGLDKFDHVTVYYIAPSQLQIRPEIVASLKHIEVKQAESYEDVLSELDFLYVTRLQKERFTDTAEYERLKGSYQLDRAALSKHERVPFLMHPLPRVDEISADLDQLPEAKYFDQARNGMYVRAALLKRIMSG